MDWNDLRFALALHESGSLTRASQALGVSHTTVARRIATLEEHLGARLFDRTTRGYVATIAGEELLAIAQSVKAQVDELDLRVLGSDARLSGELRVNTLDAFALHHAAELGSFSARYPSVDLEITVDNRPRSLTNRETDIAIRFTNSPPEHLVGRRLGRVEFALYASHELIARTADPKDLASYPWLGWAFGENAPVTKAFLRRHVPSVRHAFRVDSSVSMSAAVQAGTGVSFLACAWADPIPGIRRLRDVEPGFGVDLWMLTHVDLRRTARVRAFLDHMGEAMKPHARRLAGEHPSHPPVHAGNS